VVLLRSYALLGILTLTQQWNCIYATGFDFLGDYKAGPFECGKIGIKMVVKMSINQ